MIIVSCFAGCGKNYAINELLNNGKKVKSIEKDSKFIKSEFVSMVNDISNNEKLDVLFIPYYLGMEDKEIKGQFEYILIYPDINEKERYLKLYKELGFTKEQIQNFVDNFDEMIKDCEKYDNSRKLCSGEYAIDVIKALL